eukprot:11172188-Lingulodinium_polyedra.AAC.1
MEACRRIHRCVSPPSGSGRAARARLAIAGFNGLGRDKTATYAVIASNFWATVDLAAGRSCLE